VDLFEMISFPPSAKDANDHQFRAPEQSQNGLIQFDSV
jgi:hypothetical protein